MLHIKPPQNKLDILDLKTREKKSIQLNGLPDEYTYNGATLGEI